MVSQEVFLDVAVPYSIVRNEEVEIKVTVFNYYPRTIPVSIYGWFLISKNFESQLVMTFLQNCEVNTE